MDAYSTAVNRSIEVNNDPNSTPADIYNAVKAVAEISAPYENNPDGGYGVSIDYWMRNMSGAPDVIDNYNAYIAEGGSESSGNNEQSQADTSADTSNFSLRFG